MIRLMIVDDHEMLVQGLVLLFGLESDIEVVGTAGDGRSAVESAVTHRPDVVVMDVSMPVLDGIAATRLILAELPATRILVLSMSSQQSVVDEAFEAGVYGYLLKTSRPEAVLESVRAIHRGQRQLTPLAGDSSVW